MSNELALVIDFYMWLAVVVVFGLGLSLLAAENARLRIKLKRLQKENRRIAE